MSEIGLYADPHIYDILHTPGTADEVQGLIQTEQAYSKADPARRLWLEPACGTGRYLRLARARGINGIGFDQAEPMIHYARIRAARASSNATEKYLVASMTDFAPSVKRRVTFAFNPINSIRHLESDDAMLAHFEQMSKVLLPGAVYAVGLSLSSYGAEQPSEDVWEGARGPCRVRQVVQFIPPDSGRSETVVSHLCITTPSGEDHRTSTYALRTYSPDQFADLVRRSALRLVATTDQDGDPIEIPQMGYAVFLLARRAL